MLLVACDTLTKTVDYSDRSAAVLWGDGAAAAVLSTEIRSTPQAGLRIKEASQLGFDCCVLPESNDPATLEGGSCQLVGVRTVEAALDALIE